MPLIVIVDDRVSNRNIFAKLAATIEADLTVRTFGDPKEALEWLETNTPDLIITDYKMPHFNGAEFIRRFRTLDGCEDVPVIVITVYEERSFRLSALEAGATDFLHSPVDHYEFVTRARNLLKLQKHQQLLSQRASSLEQELEVSERTRETVVRDSSERLAQVIDTVPVMISAVDQHGVIQFANAYQAGICGKNTADFVGKPASEFFGIEHAARHLALDRMVLETAKSLPPFEEELVDAQKQTRVFLTSKSPLKCMDGSIAAVLTSSLDITARKRTESHLRHLALHDSLTGLPNRAYLHEAMRKLIARARRGDKLFALLVIDLDGFKQINDLLGHATGDRYIVQLAETLRANIREEDVLVRLGGDEFAILHTDVVSGEDAAICAARTLKVIEEDVVFPEAPVKVTASIGIALHPFDGAEDEELLKNADLAMYQAKKSPGNHFCFYASDMNARAREAALLDGRLRRAIDNDEFVLHYQPLIDAETRTIVGAEALLRWQDPDLGLVPP
ncbi:MAG: diguanylate cyclase, partial [Hyphomicrobiales bacterium]|nr:diguanylate cyclase [Hyphomicrobiales bacterium]